MAYRNDNTVTCISDTGTQRVVYNSCDLFHVMTSEVNTAASRPPGVPVPQDLLLLPRVATTRATENKDGVTS